MMPSLSPRQPSSLNVLISLRWPRGGRDMDLRDYQIKVIEDFEREVAAGKKRIILVAPTGSGKTVIGSAIIKSMIELRRGVVVIAHRREIIQQTSDKLRVNGIPHGIIMAGVEDRPL